MASIASVGVGPAPPEPLFSNEKRGVLLSGRIGVLWGRHSDYVVDFFPNFYKLFSQRALLPSCQDSLRYENGPYAARISFFSKDASLNI